MKYSDELVARIHGAMAAGVNSKAIERLASIPRGGLHSILYRQKREVEANREIERIIGDWLLGKK